MAIIIERTITINNDQATLDKPIYFYIGDVAQNSALIDIGRITEQLARLQAEVDKLKG